MERPAINIYVLTSSRADFGIYLPLLQAMENDALFRLNIIAFGTHLSEAHGYTVKEIHAQGFHISHQLGFRLEGDSPADIAANMGETTRIFSSIWKELSPDEDLVFALGDRYEMFAAIAASVPFNLKVAHFHGGETTLGAIDNVFRHCITSISTLHFTATEEYARRVANIRGNDEGVYCVGALSLDKLPMTGNVDSNELRSAFGIDVEKPTILVTFHPESVDIKNNGTHTTSLLNALKEFRDFQLVFTMPNADTGNISVRKLQEQFCEEQANAIAVESLGALRYFYLLGKCALVVGNSSSGIIEAASFGKYVVNIGDRQKGRIRGSNVLDVPAQKQAIVDAIWLGIQRKEYKGENPYWKGGATAKIISILKEQV